MKFHILVKKIVGSLFHPVRILRYLSRRGFLCWLKDETYLGIIFRLQVGKKLNLNTPKTFNEKLQWLKINNRQKIFTTMVDKVAVKKYVASRIGEKYVVPTIGVWENANLIDFDMLPNQFVLKCNHDSSSVVICRDKTSLDIKKIVKQMNYCLKNNGYWFGREWPYKNVRPCILAEPLMKNNDADDGILHVYKIMSFNGVPKIIQTIQNDKTEQETIDYFDCNWTLLNMQQNYPNSVVPLSRPSSLEEMLELSKKLSEGFAFLRIDWYEINDKPYFSEFTFFSDDGMNVFKPSCWDDVLGELITLE